MKIHEFNGVPLTPRQLPDGGTNRSAPQLPFQQLVRQGTRVGDRTTLIVTKSVNGWVRALQRLAEVVSHLPCPSLDRFDVRRSTPLQPHGDMHEAILDQVVSVVLVHRVPLGGLTDDGGQPRQQFFRCLRALSPSFTAIGAHAGSPSRGDQGLETKIRRPATRRERENPLSLPGNSPPKEP